MENYLIIQNNRFALNTAYALLSRNHTMINFCTKQNAHSRCKNSYNKVFFMNVDVNLELGATSNKYDIITITYVFHSQLLLHFGTNSTVPVNSKIWTTTTQQRRSTKCHTYICKKKVLFGNQELYYVMEILS